MRQPAIRVHDSDPFNFIKSTTIPIALALHAWPLAIIVCSRTQFFVRKPFWRNRKKKKEKLTNQAAAAVFIDTREFESGSAGNYLSGYVYVFFAIGDSRMISCSLGT